MGYWTVGKGGKTAVVCLKEGKKYCKGGGKENIEGNDRVGGGKGRKEMQVWEER